MAYSNAPPATFYRGSSCLRPKHRPPAFLRNPESRPGTLQAQITAQSLTVRRGGVPVLENISLVAESGEFITVCGESGVGKSSLLLAIAGFAPVEGHLRVEGRVGVVWQSHNVFPWMTVRRQVQFALRDHCPADQREHRLAELLGRTGLVEFSHRYPGQMSGGQVQRLGLARALAADPDILLMDEPFSALDGQRRHVLQEWLLGLWSETRKLVLFVTHDVEEAIRLGDRILVLRPGRPSAEIAVPFPRPRRRELVYTGEFNRLKSSVTMLLESPLTEHGDR